VASPDGRDGSVTIHADASIRAGLFDGDETAELALDAQRTAYVFVARGAVEVNGVALQTGDAATVRAERSLRLGRGQGAEVLVFDLAA
jgi:redox-sensitive bicupin YhaK (pirin superfamily)